MDHFFVVARLSHFDWYWWLQVSIFIIACPILLSLFIVHLVNTISDLCTAKRRSVQFNPIKPDLNCIYRSNTLLSIIGVALFMWTSTGGILWMWKYPNGEDLKNVMKWDVLIATVAWLLAKQSMYFIFLFRLHIIYKCSAYEHKSKYLILIGICSCIWTLGCCVNVVLFTEIERKYYQNIPFGAHYDLYYPFWCVIMCAFADILLSIIFIYLFVTPLRKITNQMCYQNGENIECIMEMYSFGIKILILTSMCTFTTLILLIYVLLTNTILLLPIDSIINCLCIMMMAPYYPDSKYYEKICILPIKCSKRWKIKKILPIKPIVRIETTTPNDTPKHTPKHTPQNTPKNIYTPDSIDISIGNSFGLVV